MLCSVVEFTSCPQLYVPCDQVPYTNAGVAFLIFWHMNNSKVSYALGLAVGFAFWEMVDQRLINLSRPARLLGEGILMRDASHFVVQPRGRQVLKNVVHRVTSQHVALHLVHEMRPQPIVAWCVQLLQHGLFDQGLRACQPLDPWRQLWTPCVRWGCYAANPMTHTRLLFLGIRLTIVLMEHGAFTPLRWVSRKAIATGGHNMPQPRMT